MTKSRLLAGLSAGLLVATTSHIEAEPVIYYDVSYSSTQQLNSSVARSERESRHWMMLEVLHIALLQLPDEYVRVVPWHETLGEQFTVSVSELELVVPSRILFRQLKGYGKHTLLGNSLSEIVHLVSCQRPIIITDDFTDDNDVEELTEVLAMLVQFTQVTILVLDSPWAAESIQDFKELSTSENYTVNLLSVENVLRAFEAASDSQDCLSS
jgi:hypothetical protein